MTYRYTASVFFTCILGIFLGTESSFAQLFKISAYYSPLPGQQSYVLGSYQKDLAMNGNGTHGSDGTPVYLGMISAPISYDFGTNIFIPGLGVGTVHDRGGAIYSKQGFDRLDIWMGYGDDGRRRAIQWGVQMVEGKILTSQEAEEMVNILSQNDTQIFSWNRQDVSQIEESSPQKFLFQKSLWAKHEGLAVRKMQAFLKKQGFYEYSPNGVFDLETKRAVFAFQKHFHVVSSPKEKGAGVWGPKTRSIANTLLYQEDNTAK